MKGSNLRSWDLDSKGDPQGVADRIEFVSPRQAWRADCKVTERVVKVNISTLGLEDAHAGERVDSWIEQAAEGVAARIEWRDPPG